MPGPVTTVFLTGLGISLPYYMIKNAIITERKRRARIKARKEAKVNKSTQGVKIYGDDLPVKPIKPQQPANDTTPQPVKNDTIKDETINALRNLGMTKASATKLTQQVLAQAPVNITLDDMIKRCIKALNK